MSNPGCISGSTIAGCTDNIGGLAAMPCASTPESLCIAMAQNALTSRDMAVIPYKALKKVAAHIKRLIRMLLARPYLAPEVRSYLHNVQRAILKRRWW